MPNRSLPAVRLRVARAAGPARPLLHGALALVLGALLLLTTAACGAGGSGRPEPSAPAQWDRATWDGAPWEP
jgi:hypothetical protein